MEATTKALRLHTAEILAAADRGEEVIITYRGRRRAVIRRWVEPVRDQSQADRNPAFGLWRERDGDVADGYGDYRRVPHSARPLPREHLVADGPRDTYQMPRTFMWLLPKTKVTEQLINVKAERFVLGVPRSDAFAVVDYTNARKLPWPADAQAAASTRTFTPAVARQLEDELQKLLHAP